MIFGFFKKKHSVVGVDIGSAEVKMVELGKSSKGLRLLNYAIFFLPDVSQILNKEKDTRGFHFFSPSEISFVLQRMLKEAKISSKEAYFSIPDFASFFTTFEMMSLSPEELEGAIRFEARKYIPVPLSSVVIDWSVVGEKEIAGKKRLEILLVAVLKSIVEHFNKISQKGPLRVRGMEVEVFSLGRIFSYSLGAQDAPVLVLDIGARSTICCIIEQGRVMTSYSIQIAGEDLTSRLSRVLNLDRPMAEALKRKEGLVREEGDVYAVLAPLVDMLVEEVKKALLEYERMRGEVPSRAYIVGGTANLKGLPEYLSKSLHMKVEHLPSFQKIEIPPLKEPLKKELSARLAISLGCALKGFEK